MAIVGARCFSGHRFVAAYDVAGRICCNFLRDLRLALHPLGYFSYATINAASASSLTTQDGEFDVILKSE